MDEETEASEIFREQYNRMRRWFDRFTQIDTGRAHESASDNLVDEIYAFFMNCYHLKDWIRNDQTLSGSVRQAVEPHINSSVALCICADICNSLKHLTLSGSRSGQNPAFGAKHYALTLGTAVTATISLKYEIATDDGPIDAYCLATDCVAAWDTFLTLHQLS